MNTLTHYSPWRCSWTKYWKVIAWTVPTTVINPCTKWWKLVGNRNQMYDLLFVSYHSALNRSIWRNLFENDHQITTLNYRAPCLSLPLSAGVCICVTPVNSTYSLLLSFIVVHFVLSNLREHAHANTTLVSRLPHIIRVAPDAVYED